MNDWTDVDGWLTKEEGRTLQVLAIGRTVLEIGSYKGRSTWCMSSLALRVLSVDHHRGDAGVGWEDTWDEFRELLGPCAPVVECLRASIEDVEGTLNDASFDMVFIDAAHDAPSVERHTRIALRVVRPGGILAWHDWDQADVRRGVFACGLKPTNAIGTLAWLTSIP